MHLKVRFSVWCLCHLESFRVSFFENTPFNYELIKFDLFNRGRKYLLVWSEEPEEVQG